MEEPVQQLASDNYAGVCPAVFNALHTVNPGCAPGYGEDPWTREACDKLRAYFECDCEIFFVFNGTAANAVSLAHICDPFHSVIAAETAHIETDECGAPEFFSGGSKILTAAAPLGKLTPDAVDYFVDKRSDIHYPKPRVVTLTESTECGTVYTPDEIAAVTARAHRRGLVVHMDGSRFANALAHCEVTPADLSWRAGVDVLALGGTKNGGMFGEALLFFRPGLAEDFNYRCKQSGQLASKMRYIAAQWLGVLTDDIFRINARHANAMASRLAANLADIPGVALKFPVEANAVFAEIPLSAQQKLKSAGWRFYNFIGSGGVRLMTAWDTRPETVDAFAADCRAAIS